MNSRNKLLYHFASLPILFILLLDIVACASEVPTTNEQGTRNSAQALTDPAPPGTLPIGLLGWYRGEGNANNSAAPGGGGSTFGNVTYVGRGFAGAFHFDGQSAAIELPNMWPISAGNQVTLSAWVHPDSSQTGTQRWIVGAAGRFQLILTPANKVAMGFFGADNQWHTLSNSTELSTFVRYYHYVGVLSASGGSTTLTLYGEGKQVQQATFATMPAADNGCHLWIGGVNESASGTCNYTGQFFNGAIDEVRVYGRSLSSSEIQTLYNADLANVPPPTVWYRGEVTPADEQGNPVLHEV